MRERTVFIGIGLAAALIATPVSRATVPGTIKQLGCVSENSVAQCVPARGLANTAFHALSPDGTYLYSTGRNSDAIAVLARDVLTGALRQLEGPAGCIRDRGSSEIPDCVTTDGLDRASGIAISPDGRNVYVAANVGDAVTSFARDATTGALTPLGCISDALGDPDCVPGTGLDGAWAPAVSPDGRHVYVGARDADAVAIFVRETAGAPGEFEKLRQVGCVANIGSAGCSANAPGLDGASAVALSPDGQNVYVAAVNSSAVAVFRRDAGSGNLTSLGCISGDEGYRQDGNCSRGLGLQFVQNVAVSPDGKHVYASATDSHTLAGFERDADGSLSQLPGPEGCRSDIDSGGTACLPAEGIALPLGIAFTPDGSFVYAAAFGFGTVIAMERDAVSGGLDQLGDCFGSGDSRCEQARALGRAGFVSLSADGRHLYVNAPDSGAISIFGRAETVPPASIATTRTQLRRRGAVELGVSCPEDAVAGCHGRATLIALPAPRAGLYRSVRFSAVEFRISAGDSELLTVRAPTRRLRALLKLRRFSARAFAYSRDAAGEEFESVRRIRVDVARP